MSHRTFSIGVLPIVFWKNTASILEAETRRRRGNMSNNLPNLATCPGSCALQCCHSITWAWSCRFSIWLGSFKPRVSETQVVWVLKNTENVNKNNDRFISTQTICLKPPYFTCTKQDDGFQASEFSWINVYRFEAHKGIR